VGGKQIEGCRIIGVCGARTNVCGLPLLFTRLGFLRVCEGENLNFKAHNWVVSNEFYFLGLTVRGVWPGGGDVCNLLQLLPESEGHSR
jgi:hypothetical protein